MYTSTSSPSIDPTVMVQHNQAFTANVQELMKQNEKLKRRAHSETLTMSQSRHNRNDSDNEANSPENSRS